MAWNDAAKAWYQRWTQVCAAVINMRAFMGQINWQTLTVTSQGGTTGYSQSAAGRAMAEIYKAQETVGISQREWRANNAGAPPVLVTEIDEIHMVASQGEITATPQSVEALRQALTAWDAAYSIACANLPQVRATIETEERRTMLASAGGAIQSGVGALGQAVGGVVQTLVGEGEGGATFDFSQDEAFYNEQLDYSQAADAAQQPPLPSDGTTGASYNGGQTPTTSEPETGWKKWKRRLLYGGVFTVVAAAVGTVTYLVAGRD